MELDFSQSLSGFEPLPEGYAEQLWPEAQPCVMSRTGANGIVIGLHGYRATPHEVRPVLQACHDAGLDAVSLLFAGHGFAETSTQRAAIRQMYPRALEQAVAHEVARCRALGYARVYLYGHSMGGAVALRVAAETPVDAVAVTAPALLLPARAALVGLLPAFLDLELPHGVDDGADAYRYRFDTSFAIQKVQLIAARARETLAEVRCPIFVGQARGDRTIPARVGDLIEAHAGGEVARQWFEDSGHSMLAQAEAVAVAAAVAAFLVARG